AGERIVRRVDGLRGERSDEFVLALDASDVACALGVPAALVVVLVVAAAYEGESVGAVEDVGPRRWDGEVGLRAPSGRRTVTDGKGEVHAHAPNGVGERLQAAEVLLDVVVDGDPEVLGDRRHQLARTGVEGGVDAVRRARAGN